NSLNYRYDLTYYMAYDFYEIQNKVVQRYIDDEYFTPRVEKIIWGDYPVIQRGHYDIKIKYTLPGKNEANTVKILRLTYD
ncbi:MAG: hypothetical protein R3345_15205, partial [Fulvivirga sp.]|nr:hypothetical protein [Fulvivirga sp.]